MSEQESESQFDEFLYFLLKQTIQKKLHTEIDRNQRKAEFFSATNPGKAESLTEQNRFYEKLLELTGESAGEATYAKIRALIVGIWDDHIENQNAYAQQVEAQIAEIGETATFPLLELLRDPHASVRTEALLILGKIDPELKEKVTEILSIP
jgi:hypothetical protein